MAAYEETIAAVATPPGEGAIALVRLSGPDSPKILSRLFRSSSASLHPRQATFEIGRAHV